MQLTYSNDIVYRTAVRKGDISGDYNNYPEKEDLEIESCHTTAKGSNGRIFLATWTNDKYTYSISVPHGITMENLKELIGSLAQVDHCDNEINPVK